MNEAKVNGISHEEPGTKIGEGANGKTSEVQERSDNTKETNDLKNILARKADLQSQLKTMQGYKRLLIGISFFLILLPIAIMFLQVWIDVEIGIYHSYRQEVNAFVKYLLSSSYARSYIENIMHTTLAFDLVFLGAAIFGYFYLNNALMKKQSKSFELTEQIIEMQTKDLTFLERTLR